MIAAFLVLIACELVGEVVREAFSLPIPGPVIGMYCSDRRPLRLRSHLPGTPGWCARICRVSVSLCCRDPS